MFRCKTEAFGVLLLLVVPVIFQLHKIEYETVHKADANWHINIVKIFDSFIMLAILLPSGIIHRAGKEILSTIFMRFFFHFLSCSNERSKFFTFIYFVKAIQQQ